MLILVRNNDIDHLIFNKAFHFEEIGEFFKLIVQDNLSVTKKPINNKPTNKELKDNAIAELKKLKELLDLELIINTL